LLKSTRSIEHPLDTIEQIIELYNRGEVEAAKVMIDSRDELLALMETRGLDHDALIDFLINTNSGKSKP
jgi:hypothetical protein